MPSDPCTGPVEPEQKKSSNVLRVISVISGLLIGGKIIFYFLNSSRISQSSSSIESNDGKIELKTDLESQIKLAIKFIAYLPRKVF